MESLNAFVKSNLHRACDAQESGCKRVLKHGLVDLDVLSGVRPDTEMDNARLSRVWNLCLVDPIPFSIPDEASGLEAACMRLSFHEYEGIDLSMYKLRHELVGGVPTNEGTVGNSILMVSCYGTQNRKEHAYVTREYRFDNISAASLTAEEQCILLVEMGRVFHTEVCQDLRRLKVQAYIDRVMFPENEENEAVRRTALYYQMMLDCRPWEVDFADVDVTDAVWEVPFAFMNEAEMQLAEAYYALSAFDAALEYFRKYRNAVKTIHCLVRLGRGEEAAREAAEEIERMQGSEDQPKTRICNVNILLGSITGEEEYFDRAFDAHRSHEPLRAKGMHLLKTNEFGRAVSAFKEALGLAPQNAELLFLYASALASSERFSEAAAVYERLVADDRKNVAYLRNLAMCRIQLEDVENGFKSLKQASRYDQQMMQAYFLMSLKYNMPREAVYSLERVDYFEDLQEGVLYLLESGALGGEEVRAALAKNSRISGQLHALLGKIDKLAI